MARDRSLGYHIDYVRKIHEYPHIDEEADLEACEVLTTNAENLSSAISKALHHTHSASIRRSQFVASARNELRADLDVWFDAEVS